MKITLIQLIGDQILPNIYPVLAFRPDTIVNLYSAETKKYQTVLDNSIYKITNNKPIIKSIDLTAAPNIEETQQKLQAYIENETSEQDVLIINYTGGTKLMSIGAYLVAKENALASVYLDTQSHKFHDGGTSQYSLINRFLNGEESTTKLLNSIKLETILTAHSFSLWPSQKSDHIETNKQLLALAHAIDERKQSAPDKVLTLYENGEEDRKNLDSLLMKEFDFGKKINRLCVEARLMKWNDENLKNKILILAEPHLNSKKLKSRIKFINSFLSGCWWELLLLKALKEQIQLNEILWSVEVKQGSGPRVEEDILARINTELLCVSCKISNQRGHIFAELHKLASNTISMGGHFSKPILAIYNFTDTTKETELREIAKALKITIITRENLDDLANVDIFKSHGKKPAQQVK